MKTFAFVALALFAPLNNARADTVLIDDDFDSGTLGNWTVGGGGSGLYTYDGVAATDFSTSTPGAAELYKAGTNGTLTLTEPLPLDTQGYTSLTVSLNWKFQNGSSTRRAQLQYAPDGVNFVMIREFNTPFGGNPIDGSTAVTLNEGTGGGEFEFTDTAKFRFSFGSNRSDHRAYIDDIVISGTPDFVGASGPFAITEMDYRPSTDEVVITWRSTPNTAYRAFASMELSDWTEELEDGLDGNRDENPGDGNHITVTFDLTDYQLEDEEVLFFRLEEE